MTRCLDNIGSFFKNKFGSVKYFLYLCFIKSNKSMFSIEVNPNTYVCINCNVRRHSFLFDYSDGLCNWCRESLLKKVKDWINPESKFSNEDKDIIIVCIPKYLFQSTKQFNLYDNALSEMLKRMFGTDKKIKSTDYSIIIGEDRYIIFSKNGEQNVMPLRQAYHYPVYTIIVLRKVLD